MLLQDLLPKLNYLLTTCNYALRVHTSIWGLLGSYVHKTIIDHNAKTITVFLQKEKEEQPS
jgi:hypothetical protein